MFGLQYIKFDPSVYVIQYVQGKVQREGRGLSFWYYVPITSIVAIPAGSDDVLFAFAVTTADYQQVTVQGQLTYQVEEPRRLAALLDLTVDSHGRYQSDDFEKISQRLVNEAQTAVAGAVEKMTVREALRSGRDLEAGIMESLLHSRAVEMLGIQPLSVSVLSVQPSPETARALEAKTREALQQESDEAVYARRRFAVESEREIKETELNTEIAVEEKKKQIAGKQMEAAVAEAENQRRLRELNINADVAVEDKRRELVDIQVENDKKLADNELYRLERTLDKLRQMDWRLVTALQGSSDARLQLAMAFRELAENAGKIGNLNIAPELLDRLLTKEEA